MTEKELEEVNNLVIEINFLRKVKQQISAGLFVRKSGHLIPIDIIESGKPEMLRVVALKMNDAVGKLAKL